MDFELSNPQAQQLLADINKQAQKINKYYLRKNQKETFMCAIRCCDASYSTSKILDKCVEMCFTRTNDQRVYAKSELRKFKENVENCVDGCKTKCEKLANESKNMYEAYKMFPECTKVCLEDHAFLLTQTVKEIIKNLQTKF